MGGLIAEKLRVMQVKTKDDPSRRGHDVSKSHHVKLRDAKARPTRVSACGSLHTALGIFDPQSMLLRLNASACATLTPYKSLRFPVSLSSGRFISFTANSLCKWRSDLPIYRTVAMPPKQATLGYVRPSQMTVTCGNRLNHAAVCVILN